MDVLCLLDKEVGGREAVRHLDILLAVATVIVIVVGLPNSHFTRGELFD